MRHNDGAWAGYTYEWNAGGTDATRVVGGKTVQVAGQTWDFPSEAQCLQCHTAAAGRTLGLEVGQLNGDFGYPTGRTANQLTTLNGIDTLTPALTLPPAQLPVIPDPFGGAALGLRARAYLHTNCANCHRPGGPRNRTMDFRYTTALSRDQRLRRHADAGRSRHHQSAHHRARLGGAFGGHRACESRRDGCDAAAGAAHHRHRGRAVAHRLGQRSYHLQLKRIPHLAGTGQLNAEVPLISRRASLRTSGSACRSSR